MLSRRDLLAAGPALSALNASPVPASRPNFIVIVADDLGCRDLGCFGAADLKTPHLDALAASGARFENWYSNAPVCAPSRSAIQTGRYPIHAGVPANGPALSPRQKTIATLLKPLGYATACVGKWHLGYTPDTVPNAHGYDYYYGFQSGCVDFYSHRYYWGEPRQVNYHDLWRNREEIFEDGQYITDRITAETCQFIARHKAQPFFAYVAYNAPHYPMHAPEKYLKRFPGLDPERRTYAAMIAAVDDGIGEIVKTLKQEGLTGNTMIVFIGDNGATTEKRAGMKQEYAQAGKNGAFRGFKFSLFDGGMHVPGLMNWPGKIPGGQVLNEIVMSMDILPTICKAAGAPIPIDHAIDGKDILPVATAKAASPHPAIFWAQNGQLAVRRAQWKLVIDGALHDRSEEGKKPLKGEDALFLSNLAEDPGELRNLRHRHPELVDELSTMAHRWLEDIKAAK
ncbi:MAG: sulfatase-like hydrolase/transferase [Bryobacteraceae bacterium]